MQNSNYSSKSQEQHLNWSRSRCDSSKTAFSFHKSPDDRRQAVYFSIGTRTCIVVCWLYSWRFELSTNLQGNFNMKFICHCTSQAWSTALTICYFGYLKSEFLKFVFFFDVHFCLHYVGANAKRNGLTCVCWKKIKKAKLFCKGSWLAKLQQVDNVSETSIQRENISYVMLLCGKDVH